MVASSVVLTVVVLNYHHRTADIHEMPQWVRRRSAGGDSLTVFMSLSLCLPDQVGVPAVAAVDPGHEQAGEEDHAEDDTHEQSHERARAEGAFV